MTTRVIQRKSYDRFGSPVLTDAGALRWVLEQEDGPILTRTYFDTEPEAQRAKRELQRLQSSWEIATRSADWRL